MVTRQFSEQHTCNVGGRAQNENVTRWWSMNHPCCPSREASTTFRIPDTSKPVLSHIHTHTQTQERDSFSFPASFISTWVKSWYASQWAWPVFSVHISNKILNSVHLTLIPSHMFTQSYISKKLFHTSHLFRCSDAVSKTIILIT